MKDTNFKRYIIRIHWILSEQLGVDFLRFIRFFRELPLYFRDLMVFKQGYKGRLLLRPCVHDRYEEGGTTKNEYFWQDLIVARKIFETKPEKHVDIGSRVDGFVAHVASFREIEVFDVREISTEIPAIMFKKIDFAGHIAGMEDYCDSISCLHAIEHFGLGRYGDTIDAEGYKHGIRNMAKLLKPFGKLYISAPIGEERVEFNGMRVFRPYRVIDCAKENGLKLEELIIISPKGEVTALSPLNEHVSRLADEYYNLGVFIFSKEEKI
jgi:hypothetical protein